MIVTIKPSTIIAEIPLGQKRILLTSCHRIPSRSIIFRGKPLICYRCAGMNLAFFLTMLYVLAAMIFNLASIDVLFGLEGVLSGRSILLRFLIALLLQLPFIIDGTLQLLISKYESRNPLRLITGLLGGFGQFYGMFAMGRLLKYLILT